VVRKRPVLASGSVVRIADVSPIITGRAGNTRRTRLEQKRRQGEEEGYPRSGLLSSSPCLLFILFRVC
jgi:hypothetical protein